MVHGADKQCSSLYAVDFMSLAFPDGVENGQNVNFQNFEMLLLRILGTEGSLYVANTCATVWTTI